MGQARELVEQWLALFEAEQIDDLVPLMHADAHIAMSNGTQCSGPEQFKPVLHTYHDGFSQLRHEVIHVVETENQIAIELRITGVHTGVLHTLFGDIPPTGKTLAWDVVNVVTIDDGKAVRWKTYFDQMAIPLQLDLLPKQSA